MRRITTIAVFSLVLFIGLAGWSSAATRQAKCPNSVAAIVIADAQVEVYEAPGHGANEGLVVALGCAYAQGRSYRLGVIDECIGSSSGACGFSFEHETLAGPVVAYTEEARGSNKDAIFVRDLRNGRLLYQATSVVGRITDVVVKSDGAVAWIAENKKLSSREVGYYEVNVIDKLGSRVLALGNNINPFSLALASRSYHGAPPEIYWTQGGRAFSAPLN
jgi:hypothetical protein